MTGFDVAADGPVLVVMADLSDDLAQVDRMMELYRQGYHVIAGSRYMKGGRLIGGPFFKQMLSRMAVVSPPWLPLVPPPGAHNAVVTYAPSLARSLPVQSPARSGFTPIL